MKRIALLLALCLIILNLLACCAEQEQTISDTSFLQANFNNNYWFSGNFWAFEDNIFYLQDGFYNMGAYWSTNGNNDKLFEESDFANDSTEYTSIGDIFVFDSCLYFELNTDQEDRLFRYNLKESTCVPVCEIPSLYRWVVVDNYFIYREHPSNNDKNHSPLCIYNLMDDTTTQVCANVEEFGIVDGQLRYITFNDNYELHQYNYAEDVSSVLGTFSCDTDNDFDIFNFTTDAVVMFSFGKNNQDLFVYTLSSDTTAIYALPKGIHQMVAYDQYAYLVVYDEHENSSFSVAAKDNGIYRIDLSDGSYRVVESDANDDTKIHVVSDDDIYIIQSEMNFLFQAHRHVYFFDCGTGSKEKLIII